MNATAGPTPTYVERARGLEPSELHAELRAEGCPVHHVTDHDPSFHVLSHHADVMAALRSPGLWRNADGPGVFVQQGGVLGSADDPDHRRQRSVLQDEFRPARLARLEPFLRQSVDHLGTPFTQPGEGDVVALFAFALPALAAAELLGVRHEDRHLFRDWAEAIVAALGGGDLTAYERATREVWGYIDRLVDERISLLDAGEELPVDVISTMTLAHRGGSLSRVEVRRLGHQLLVAGHETTTSLISLMFLRLAQHPELHEQLHRHPELIEAAVEELLRLESPVQGLFRTNAEACTVGGVDLPAGSKVQMLYASANRDPEVWDDPDEIRLDRDARHQRAHLAFGWGVHHCIGAPLARMEARLALERIVHGLARIEVIDTPVTASAFILRGLARLDVRWEPRA
jgi:cytochrome P450